MEFSGMVKILSKAVIIWCVVVAIFTRIYFYFPTIIKKVSKQRCTNCSLAINCDRKLSVEGGRLIPSLDNPSKILRIYERKQRGKNKYEKFWRKVLSNKYEFTRKKQMADVIIDMEQEEHENKLVGFVLAKRYWHSNKEANEKILENIISQLDCDPLGLRFDSFFFNNIDKCKEFFMQQNLHDTKWIFKENEGTFGRGINLVRNMTDFISQYGSCKKEKNYHVQRFLDKPFLWDGHKFDYRVHAFIARTNPLLIFVEDGYFRVSIRKYDEFDPHSIKTNLHYSQKSDNFSWEFCVRHLHKLESYLESEDLNKWNSFTKPQIYKMIVMFLRSNLQLQPDGLKFQNRFGWYGFDFMIDENLQPYYTETNRWPGHDYFEHDYLDHKMYMGNWHVNMFEILREIHSNLRVEKIKEIGARKNFTLIYNEIDDMNQNCPITELKL